MKYNFMGSVEVGGSDEERHLVRDDGWGWVVNNDEIGCRGGKEGFEV
jgi:hypothetical protein